MPIISNTMPSAINAIKIKIATRSGTLPNSTSATKLIPPDTISVISAILTAQ